MKTDFDFDKTKRRMPYTVPDNFFSEMEARVFSEIESRRPAGVRYGRVAIRIVAAAAAAAALIFALNTGFSGRAAAGFSDVEKAFGNLSDEDRDYMLSVYREDIFINEQNEEL